MHKVVSEIERPPADTVSKFEGLPTAVISDVTGKYENTMSSDIKPVYDDASLVGNALTVKCYPGDNLMIHKAITMAEPGDVLVVDANEYEEAGLWGELASISSQAHGIKGTVIDGAVRDITEIEEVGYPVYSRAVSPKGSYKSHPGSINVPVSCGGVTVNPGDVVVGDDEGVAVVRREHANEVAADARQKLDDEMTLKKELRDGTYIYDINSFDEVYDDLPIREV